MRFRFFTFLFVLITSFSFGQEVSRRCKTIARGTERIYLDSLVVEPSTIDIPDSIKYSYDINSGFIVFEKSPTSPIQLCYRVLPFRNTAYFKRSYIENYNHPDFAKDRSKRKTVQVYERELFHTGSIRKSGSISRSISFGNNQDVFFNSQLNLQLDGQLTDNLNIRASITDRNIPFQPEGNTAQIQDFDKVFIEVYNDDFSLIAGDVLLEDQDSYFLKFRKNVQGGQFSAKYDVGKFKAESGIGVSVAKGRFASTTVDVIEGVQGPYRIRGPNNERFIIILSGSEKVFLDGIQLERGFDKDYVIDYNTAEIEFTNNILISKFSRIRVDFEFSIRNFSRSILQFSHKQSSDRVRLFTNFYSEKDNRNRPLAIDLTDADKDFISSLGDNSGSVFVSSIDSITFNENEVLYRKTDTVDLDGNIQSVLVQSSNPEEAHFRATFFETGVNRGNYVLGNNQLNGRAFRWVSPVNGIPQGNFEPVEPLTAPEKRNVLNFGGEFDVSDFETVGVELAISNQDRNLFSDLDDEDNTGQAVRVNLKSEDRRVSFLNEYQISSKVSFEFVDGRFTPIDRFRRVEYNRDWSFNPTEDTLGTDDFIFESLISAEKDLSNRFSYGYSKRSRGEFIDGTQHEINLSRSLGKLYLTSKYFSLRNEQEEFVSEWERFQGNLHFSSFYLTPGYEIQVDRNRRSAQDSVVSSLNNFEQHTVYLEKRDTSRLNYRVSYTLREDRSPFEGQLIQDIRSRTIQSETSTSLNDHDFSLLFSYRENDVFQEDSINPILEKVIKITGEWNGHLLDNHISGNLLYTAANSRELRRIFVFVPVNTGEGTHAWRDLNGDGVQDINEFFEAINPDEQNFIKVFNPTDDFVVAFNNVLNARVNARLPRKWLQKQGLIKAFGKLENSTSWNVERRTTASGAERFNPFKRNLADENLLSLRENILSTFYFDRSNRGLSFNSGISRRTSRQLISQGFDTRSATEYRLESRYAIGKAYTASSSTFVGEKAYESDIQLDGDYSLDGYGVGQRLTWQPNRFLRLTGGYDYRYWEDQFSEDVTSFSRTNEYRLEFRYSKAAKSSFNAVMRFLTIDFEGEENSPSGYELLQALRPGDNITFNFNWQRYIGKALQLNLNYNVRKSPETDAIQLGRVQVSALF
ncbi:MAG: hypothetical protein AAF363_21570 [Bacteroidota bacterium]